MDDVQRAWVAGILEGEGSFILRDGHRPAIQLAMTDEDVVRRVQATCGVGAVHGPYEYGGFKPQWKFHVTQSSDAASLMREIHPLMGHRRSAKITEVLEAWDSWESEGRAAHNVARRVVDEDTRRSIRERYNDQRGVLTALSKEFGVSRITIKKIAKEEW